MVFKNFSATINGDVFGRGKDDVGLFDIKGSVNAFGDAQFVKTYPTHAVMYSGKLDGKSLSGTWSLAGMTGSFSISRMQKTWTGYYLQDGN